MVAIVGRPANTTGAAASTLMSGGVATESGSTVSYSPPSDAGNVMPGRRSPANTHASGWSTRNAPPVAPSSP